MKVFLPKVPVLVMRHLMCTANISPKSDLVMLSSMMSLTLRNKMKVNYRSELVVGTSGMLKSM